MAKDRSLTPVLAGRRAEHSSRLRVNWALNRAFSISPIRRLSQETSKTSRRCFTAPDRSPPPAGRCSPDVFAPDAHYLDITGEIAVFEDIHARSEEFRNAGIVVIPGVGFDVVPTDCLAAMLKRELPSATHLKLAFKAA